MRRTKSMVRVRRQRPAGGAWAAAFLCVMLVVYGVTLSVKEEKRHVQANAPKTVHTLALDGLEMHLVQLGAFSDRSAARVAAAREVSRGAAGYVMDGSVYRVIAAGYASREAAETVCMRLAAEEKMDACVYSLSSGACEGNITATQEQFDALIAAEKTIRLAENTLAETADLLYRGDILPRQAQNILAVLESDLSGAHSRLASAYSGEKSEIASGFLQLLRTLCESCGRLSNEMGLTNLYFSSQIRYSYIQTGIEHIRFLKSWSSI